MPPEATAAPQATSPQTPANGAAAPAAGGGGEPSWEQIKETAIAESEKAEGQKPKPKPGTPEPPKERKPKHSEWAVYEHKVKKLTEERRAFDAKQEEGRRSFEAVEKRTAELDQREKLLSTLETDPKAFVEHFARKVGMTPTKVVNALNEFFLERKSPVELELAKFREEQKTKEERAAEEKKKAEADAAKQAGEAKVRGYVNKIAQHVVANADNYTFLATYPPGAVAESAWARIEKHYEETGRTIELDKILEKLESEEEAKYLRMEERRRTRQATGGQQGGGPNHEGVASATNRDAQQRPTTLNHRLAGQRTPQARGQSDQEDWEEAKRQAGMSR